MPMHTHARAGDDSINETKHKFRRNMKARTAPGGRRKTGQEWKCKLRVEDHDHDGKGLGTFHVVHYTKRAPRADFDAVHRRNAVCAAQAAKKSAPRLLTPRVQETKREEAEIREAQQLEAVNLLLALKDRVM